MIKKERKIDFYINYKNNHNKTRKESLIFFQLIKKINLSVKKTFLAILTILINYYN
jgi:hypothetical protein